MCYLDAGVRKDLHAYLAATCRDHGCHAYRVGGTDDHIHIATTLGRGVTQRDLIQVLKQPSSKWIKEQGQDYHDFYWQRGYGAFSVSPTHLDDLVKYIDGQEEHHRTVSFKEEFQAFLERYDIVYDDQYVWD